jgi:pSer/pThr/pTyr-binding forkhead associated (FHA) protein
MNAQLVGRVRRGITETFNIRGEEVVLGREPGKGIAIAAEGVSRAHARILWDGKNHWLEDLKSTNGTFLNGNQVSRERLRHLDVVTLGKKVDLVFMVRGERATPTRREGILRAALIPEEADATPYEVPMGETTLGRSSATNVNVESGAVSKMHARIERTVDQLMIQDLDSSNGTFVNGARVSVTPLHDGDVISLASVASFRLEVERGEISSSGIYKSPAVASPAAAQVPRYSEEWKTRLDWSSGERALIAEFRQRLTAAEAERAVTGKNPVALPKTAPPPAKRPVAAADRTDRPQAKQPPAAGRGVAAADATVPPPQKPAPPAASPKPAAAAPAAPSPPPASAVAPAPPRPVVAPAAAAARPAAPPPVTTAATPPPAAAAPAPVAAPPRPSPAAAPPSQPATAAPPPEEDDLVPTMISSKPLVAGIAEVRLTGRDTALSVTAPGSYDIGRSREVPLRVSESTVSRRHARIILADDRLTAFVEHAGGANGTRLNGALVTERQPLSDGDQIEVGELPLKVSIVSR